MPIELRCSISFRAFGHKRAAATFRRALVGGSALCLIGALSLLAATPASAQFGGFNLGGSVVQKAKDGIRDQISKAIAGDPPLLLDQKSAFAQVPAPDGFSPTKLVAPDDINKPLQPADYSVAATFYCSEWSIHRPAQGVAYKMGRVAGRMRLPICALLDRGTEQGIDEAALNCTAWRIEAGIPESEWPQTDQDMAHRVIPDYENQLNGDYIAQIKGHYDQTVEPLTQQSFDDYLGTLGDMGQQILQIEQARQVLMDQSISDDQMPDLLYQRTGGGGPMVVGTASPSWWCEVLPGVIARYTIIDGYLGKNLLEFRITSRALTAYPTGPTLAEIIGMDETKWPKGPDNLIGYPVGTPSQIPIIVPYPTDLQTGN